MEKFQSRGSELISLNPEERKLYDYVYHSFRFSQGDIRIQKELFALMGEKGYLEPLRSLIQDEPPSYITSLMYPKKHVEIPRMSNEENRLSDISKVWSKLRLGLLLTCPYKEDFNREMRIDNLRIRILEMMLSRDVVYQIAKRPGREKDRYQPDSNDDPHASFLRKYAVHGVTTGLSEYDSIFAELKPIISSLKQTTYASNDFSKDAVISDRIFTLENL